MVRHSLSILVLSAFVTSSAFAAVTSNPNATSKATSKQISEESLARKRNLLTIEMIGSSSSISLDGTTTATVGSSSVSVNGNGSLSGTSPVQGIALGFTGKPTSSFGLEGNIAYITKKFDQAEYNGKPDSDNDTDASTKISTVRAAGLARFYPSEYISFGAGMYASNYVGKVHETNRNGVEKDSSFDDTGMLNRFDYGTVFGARGEIPLSESMAFVVDARYFLGFANLYNQDKIVQELENMGATDVRVDQSGRTRDFQFGAGIGYSF